MSTKFEARSPPSKLSSGLKSSPKLTNSPKSLNSPKSKDLSHVPCKFFRQGACTAGSACPFSHATGDVVEQAPCKYFQKGNCKFGPKCALAHILPDGRRVNPPRSNNNSSSSHHANEHHAHGQNHNNIVGNSSANGSATSINTSANGSHAANGSNGHHSLPMSPSANGQSLNLSSLGPAPGTPSSSGTPSSFLSRRTSIPASIPATSSPHRFSVSIPQSNSLASNAGAPIRSSPHSFHRSMSSGSPSIWSSTTRDARSSLGMFLTTSQQNAYDNESAVAEEDEMVFDEEGDFVPMALNDLLTPQERQRRSSRGAGILSSGFFGASVPRADAEFGSAIADDISTTPRQIPVAKSPQQSAHPSLTPSTDLWGSAASFRNKVRTESVSHQSLQPIGTPPSKSHVLGMNGLDHGSHLNHLNSMIGGGTNTGSNTPQQLAADMRGLNVDSPTGLASPPTHAVDDDGQDTQFFMELQR